MDIKPIKSEEEYQKALVRFNEVFDAPEDTAEGAEAQIWALIIGDYEDRHYPIDPPDPIERIKFRMEQMGLRQADLIDAFGGRNRASEVLNKKRRLTLDMIRKLSERLNIRMQLLLSDYQLETDRD